jgi:DNA-directed RNA polymerase II subunit RPB3
MLFRKFKPWNFLNTPPVTESSILNKNESKLTQKESLPILEVEKSRGNELAFAMKDAKVEQVNQLRRKLLTEIYTMAIDRITVYANSSIMPDETLVHRVGLIPIFCNQIENFNLFEECLCEEKDTGCRDCSVKFRLKVEAKERGQKVTSDDIQFEDERCSLSFEGNIPIIVLNKGEKVELTGSIFKGTAVTHAKWCPVAAVRLKPDKEFKDVWYCLFEDTYQLPFSSILSQIKSAMSSEISSLSFSTYH